MLFFWTSYNYIMLFIFNKKNYQYFCNILNYYNKILSNTTVFNIDNNK